MPSFNWPHTQKRCKVSTCAGKCQSWALIRLISAPRTAAGTVTNMSAVLKRAAHLFFASFSWIFHILRSFHTMLCRDSYVLKHMSVCPDASNCITSNWNPEDWDYTVYACCASFFPSCVEQGSSAAPRRFCLIGKRCLCCRLPRCLLTSLRIELIAFNFSPRFFTLGLTSSNKVIKAGMLSRAELSWTEPAQNLQRRGRKRTRRRSRDLKQTEGAWGGPMSPYHICPSHTNAHTLWNSDRDSLDESLVSSR